MISPARRFSRQPVMAGKALSAILSTSFAERAGHCRSRSTGLQSLQETADVESTPESSGPTSRIARSNAEPRGKRHVGQVRHA